MDEAYTDDARNRLVARWGGDDGDGTGKLSVAAAADGFAGVGAAWFDRGQVIEFGAALAAYPLPDEDIELASGFWSQSGAGLAQEHVGIRVGLVGNRGQIGVRVHLATEFWPDARPEAQQDVRLELLTTYQRLAVFSRDLAHAVDDKATEAILGGEKLMGY